MSHTDSWARGPGAAHAELALRSPASPRLRGVRTGIASLRDWRSGVAGTAARIGLLFLAALGLDHGPTWSRWVLGVAGVFALSRGLDVLGKVRFGPGFQTGLWLAAIWVGII